MGKNDIAAVLIAQKTMAALGVNPVVMAQSINIQKTVAENGVPAVEIARVINDAGMPQEMFEILAEQAVASFEKPLLPTDVDAFVSFYDNLRLKANIPSQVVEFIDSKLIQVRCSLEDVADNMVASQLARGEKESMVVRGLCETLLKTGASAEIVATTMMAALRRVLTKHECDIMKDVGRTLHEQGTESELKLICCSIRETLRCIVVNLLLQSKACKRP